MQSHPDRWRQIDDGHRTWQQRAPRRVAKHKPYRRIVQDKGDGLLREFDIGGDCDKASAHDGEVSDQHFGAVERNDRDPVPAPKTPCHERACAGINLPVELAVRQCSRVCPIATVDQGRLRFRRRGIAEVAKIDKIAHVELPNADIKQNRLPSWIFSIPATTANAVNRSSRFKDG